MESIAFIRHVIEFTYSFDGINYVSSTHTLAYPPNPYTICSSFISIEQIHLNNDNKNQTILSKYYHFFNYSLSRKALMD